MKAIVISILLLPGIAAAEPDRAPFINHQIEELTKKVDDDLAAGALTKSDGDELKRAIQHVQSVEQSEPTLTLRTRRDLREQLSGIQKNLERKEAQAKALGSPSPSATP
jgi:uncharacterized coiled-coil DUF342 family protein